MVPTSAAPAPAAAAAHCGPARVGVVDDSSVVRSIVSRTLDEDPRTTCVGTARNGRLGLDLVRRERPDALILDLEMPEMDGLEALRALRHEPYRPKVLMFSTLTDRGTRATIQALALGAADYLCKPSQGGTMVTALHSLRVELLDKLAQLCPDRMAPLVPEAPAKPVPVPPSLRRPVRNAARVDLVAIGSSTGGPAALEAVLGKFKAPPPLPFVLVQHMPPVFTKHLAERLDRETVFSVREAQDGDSLTAGRLLVAPGGRHMEVVRDGSHLVVHLNDAPPQNSCRPAVDVLFASVARTVGAHALGVVLTGMGRDGLKGAVHMRGQNARVVVQDEATSVVWGMPGAIAREGLADAVVPLADMPHTIARACAHKRLGAARPRA